MSILLKSLFLLLFLFTPFLFGAGGNFGGGDGSKEKPFLIEDLDDLSKISSKYVKSTLTPQTVPNKNTFFYFKLTHDLDLKGKSIEPICMENPNGFQGFFDGNGKKIFNFKITLSKENHVGFFSQISAGVIQNLTLEKCSISGYSAVGTLAGSIQTITDLDVLIDNCRVTQAKVEVNAPAENQKYTVGGVFAGENIALYSNTIIINCHVNDSEICCRASSVDTIGGFVGWNGVLAKRTMQTIAGIKQSSAKCDFKFSSHILKNIGGLVGRNEAACFWDNSQALALLQDCSAEGDIEGLQKIGGLVGSSESYMNQSKVIIERCRAEGRITGTGKQEDIPFFIGGLVGICASNSPDSSAEIRDSYFIGKVKCKKSGNEFIGGLVGLVFDRQKSNKLNIVHSYADSDMDISGQRLPYTAGGFVGGNDNGKYESCYWVGKALSGEKEKFKRGNRPIPIAKNEAGSKSTFKGWDFEKVWLIKNSRPYLRYCGLRRNE